MFNVQIFNSISFTRITGCDPPPTTVNAAVYRRHGYPLYNSPDEIIDPTSRSIDVKMERDVDTSRWPTYINDGHVGKCLIVRDIANHVGPKGTFRTYRDIQRDIPFTLCEACEKELENTHGVRTELVSWPVE